MRIRANPAARGKFALVPLAGFGTVLVQAHDFHPFCGHRCSSATRCGSPWSFVEVCLSFRGNLSCYRGFSPSEISKPGRRPRNQREWRSGGAGGQLRGQRDRGCAPAFGPARHTATPGSWHTRVSSDCSRSCRTSLGVTGVMLTCHTA